MIKWKRLIKEETEEGAFKVGDRVRVADTYKGKPTTGGRFSYDPPSAGMTGTVVDINRQRYHDFKSGSMGIGMSREKTRMWYIVKIDDSCGKGCFVPGEYGFDERDLVKIDTVNEAYEDVNIKKLLRQNGITKLPSGMSSRRDGMLEWRKERGYAGEKTIDAMRKQAEEAGWKRQKEMDDAHPDGSWVARGDGYISPDGQIEMTYYSHYGATSYDNSFSITFKLVGGVNESSRFGFTVGDRVVLTKDKSNRFSGDFICAGTEGEIVAVDKPMPGVMKVKIEDWKTISVPERNLKKVGEDEEPWKKLKKPEEPKRDIRPERPEDYYMRLTSYGSPRFTGD